MYSLLNCSSGFSDIKSPPCLLASGHLMYLLHLFTTQVYRVSDMELVRVLPSAEDEVNVACFHPSVGGGLVYGTKVSI